MKSMIEQVNYYEEKIRQFEHLQLNALNDPEEYDENDLNYYKNRYNYYRGKQAGLIEALEIIGFRVYPDCNGQWVARS